MTTTINKETLGDFLKQQSKSKTINKDGYEIHLVSLNIAQQLEIEEAHKNKEDHKKLIGLMLKCCWVDQDGLPLFDSLEDIEKIPADLAVFIFKECLTLSNIDAAALDEKSKN